MPTISRTTFLSVYDRCAGCCFYCGWPYVAIGSELRDTEGRNIVLEHMTPRCRGGSDEPENLTIACDRCNIAKAKRTVEEFREWCKAQLLESLTRAIFSPGGLPDTPITGPLIDIWRRVSDHPLVFPGERPNGNIRGEVTWKEANDQ